MLKFKKGQTPDPGDSNELFNITVAKVGQDMVGSMSFKDSKCIWTDMCEDLRSFVSYIPQTDVSLIDEIVIESSTFVRVDFGNSDGNENENPYEFWVGEGLDGVFSFIRDDAGRIFGNIENITSSMMTEFWTNDSGEESSSEFPIPLDVGEDIIETDDLSDLNEDYISFDFDDGFTEIITPSSVPQSKRQLESSGMATIDILFVWTGEAECRASRKRPLCMHNSETEALIRKIINLGVRSTNAQLRRSGVDIQIRNVHSYRHPTYVEDSDTFPDAWYPDHLHAYSCLSGGLDGCLTDVPAIRSHYNADLVNVVLSNYGGYGATPRTPDPRFFYMTSPQETFQILFRHEFGHNMVRFA